MLVPTVKSPQVEVQNYWKIECLYASEEYTNFINMSYFSIQGLLSSQPYTVVGKSGTNNSIETMGEND